MGWPTTSRYDYDLRMRGAFARALAPNPDPHQVKEGFCYGHAWAESEQPQRGRTGWPNNLTGANSWPDEVPLPLTLTLTLTHGRASAWPG